MNKITFTVVVAAVVFGSPIVASANPILPPNIYGGYSTNGALWLFIAPSAMLIEYLVVRWLLCPWAGFRHVLPSFFVINLITLPITQFLGVFIVWLAEIVPVAVEPQLYRWYFRRRGVEVPRLRARIIGANIVSFGIGLVMYHIIAAINGV